MKYQNVSGFRQVIVVEGKKTVVFEDQVIEVSHELFNPAFEKVADNSVVTFKARTIKKPSSNQENISLVQFESKLEEVKKDSATADDVTQAVSKITELESNVAKSQSKHGSELAEFKKEFSEFKILALKRMEILKSAVKTLEYEVGQLYTDDDTEEDNKGETFRQQ